MKSRRTKVEIKWERERKRENEQRTLNKPHAQFVNQQTKIVVIHIEAIQMFMRIANQLKTVNVFVMCMSKYKLYLVWTSILADENDLNTDEHSTSIQNTHTIK